MPGPERELSSDKANGYAGYPSGGSEQTSIRSIKPPLNMKRWPTRSSNSTPPAKSRTT
jgi:hypothetical protein